MLTLASKSAARTAMLQGAGLDFAVAWSGVDEDAVKAELLGRGDGPVQVARVLAARKAEAVSRTTGGLVIGADQTLELDGRLYDKVGDLRAARERLLLLRWKTHRLHSAVAVAEQGRVVWNASDSASLTARAYSDGFIDDYLARNGQVLGSVGCYMLEGEGVQLFDRVEGDWFTILGMPLLPLLAYLRERGVLRT